MGQEVAGPGFGEGERSGSQQSPRRKFALGARGGGRGERGACEGPVVWEREEGAEERRAGDGRNTEKRAERKRRIRKGKK